MPGMFTINIDDKLETDLMFSYARQLSLVHNMLDDIFGHIQEIDLTSARNVP